MFKWLAPLPPAVYVPAERANLALESPRARDATAWTLPSVPGTTSHLGDGLAFCELEILDVGFSFRTHCNSFRARGSDLPAIKCLSPTGVNGGSASSLDRVLPAFLLRDSERDLRVLPGLTAPQHVRFALQLPPVNWQPAPQTSSTCAFPGTLCEELAAPKSGGLGFKALALVGMASIDVVLPPPPVCGKVFSVFSPVPLRDASERSRREASRIRFPEDDPFSALFFILLAKHNWDVRVLGLDALLAAYPEGKRPFSFQYEGIDFLVRRERALLADEMGLGKTIQAVLAMRAAIHAGKMQRVLIVCPKSLLATWHYEIRIWAPELSATIVHGDDKHARIRRPHHVYITNYESVERVVLQAHLWSRGQRIRPFDLLIIDEVQNLKNSSTKRSKAIAQVAARSRWGLTGTPLENAFSEYRAVWRAIDPEIRGSMDDVRFLRVTKPNVLRREKDEVLRDLPKKLISVQFVELEGNQLRRYEELEAQIQGEVQERVRRVSPASNNQVRMHIFKLMTELKKVCIYDDKSRQSAKMDWIEERLEEMHPDGIPLEHCEKALVFTQFSNLVWDSWRLQRWVEKYNPLRYDASLRDDARHRFPERFQGEEKHRVAFIGLKAGGTGLTLTRANQVIFLDHWWNPAVMEQAAARVHRFGQSRACYVTSLVAKDTIDERILAILDRKKAEFERIMKEIKEGRRSPADLDRLETALTLDDMLEALGLARRGKSATQH